MTNPLVGRERIASIDLLKGLVMVIMALDHTRDFFHAYSFYHDPADPLFTSWPIFFTRWITHFCAPIFSFLAGLSAFFIGRRKTKAQLSVFLLKRGLWLVFIELTVVAFAWRFDPAFTRNGLAVIWVLGVSMIITAALIHLPRKVLLAVSLAIIFSHNLLDNIHNDSLWWALLHVRSNFPQSNGHIIGIGYPLIPWFAIMSLGYCFGEFYQPQYGKAKRRKIFLQVGLLTCFLFFVLRFVNVYGDSRDWTSFATFSQRAIAFLDPVKYPPSLLYTLMTLGPALIFLALSEDIKGKWANFFSTYGRVPFFYYIIHLYFIHIGALILAEFSGFGWRSMVNQKKFVTSIPELQGYGISLAGTYAVWLIVIFLTYPLCRMFEKYKLAHKEKWWLSYL